MSKEPKSGEKVSWNSAEGKIKGKIVKKLTATTKIKGHTAKATPDAPQYLVESDKTGAKAAHKPEQLKKA